MGFYNSFVVRIWSSTNGKPDRGYIQHVGTQDKKNFLDIYDVVEFIQNHLVHPGNKSTKDTQTPGTPETIEYLEDLFNDERSTK
jgi:hypothetical protein